jgi:alginate O-acetyltransferase complex protein AlgI
MLFNTLTYLIFFIIVYAFYCMLKRPMQNILLLIANYIFYGWWDIRFLFLIAYTTSIDFACATIMHEGKIEKKDRMFISFWIVTICFLCVVVQWKNAFSDSSYNLLELFSWHTGWAIFGSIIILVIALNICYLRFIEKMELGKKRKLVLFITITTNLIVLGFFKYFNFFIANLESMINSIGINPQFFHLNIILPVGISFYTFQSISYTVDVYKKKVLPAKHFFDLALYNSFFPQLVAGPIERGANLLPQVLADRKITKEKSIEGLFLIFYGLFKKMVIADGVAGIVNHIYNSHAFVSWLDVVVATVMFAIQIYCDFSGYTDIARGSAKLLGFELMLNFNFPYFSKNPKEFWSRWHISLSSWLRDYLYIPLGGNRKGKLATQKNLLITMLLGGLWHGASWNFILWGFYHGMILIIHKIFVPEKKQQSSNNIIKNIILTFFFFAVTCYGWLLFRAGSFDTIVHFTKILFFRFGDFSIHFGKPKTAVLFGLPMFAFMEFTLYFLKGKNIYKALPVPMWTACCAVLFIIFLMGLINETSQFIYFTF